MGIAISRRDFLRDSLAALGFTALPGGFLFAAPEGWKPEKKPNLVFGVLSDTHLRTRHGPTGKPGLNWPHKYFRNALEYFKLRGVDAVINCGDMAHRGQVEELQYHANVWNRVFGRNGGPVKLFVCGNHDTDGAEYGNFVANKYPDPKERAKHVLATDMAANWERIWGEKYEPVWHKEVKGYHFFGRHQRVDDGELVRLVNETGKTVRLDDPLRPFFFMTHSRPRAPLRKRVSANRNAVAFFGHNHWSIANWNMAYLYYNRLPCFECASCEPRGCAAIVGDGWITKAKLEGRNPANVGKGRQGYVVCLYDDMMVLERHEFSDGEASLGADWVMPLGRSRPHPLAKTELKKAIGEPQFRKGAKLEVAGVGNSIDNAENDFAKGARAAPPAQSNRAEALASAGKEVVSSCCSGCFQSIKISIPLADGNPASRVYAYEVVVVDEKVAADAPKLLKAVYAAGCNVGIGREPNSGVTELEITEKELRAAGPMHQALIAVRPLSSLGTAGRAITAKLKLS